jgi:hypothetical protein
LATGAFLDLFRDVKVWHIQTMMSDHCALVVECLEHSLNRRRRKRNFRYENMRQRDPGYMATIWDAWSPQGVGVGLGDLQLKLQDVQSTLRNWEQDVVGSVRKTLASLRRELEEVRGQSMGSGPSGRERQIMAWIAEMLSREVMER